MGSLVTYFIQSKLQDRAEKKKITREKIEKIYGPLYVELQNIKKKLINNLESIGSEEELTTWEKIKTYPEFFSIPLKLKDEVEDFFKKAQKLSKSLYEVKRIVDYILIEVGTSVFKPYYKNTGTRISKKSVQGYLFIAIRSKMGILYFTRSLHYYVILNKDPIEDMKQKLLDFSPKKCQIHLLVEDPKKPHVEIHIDIPLTKIQEDLNQCLEIAKQKIVQEKEVLKFLEERSKVSEGIDKLLPIIKRHIERNYPIERI